MLMNPRILSVWLVCLALALVGVVLSPAQGAEPAWSPIVEMDHQIFPSLLIATATIRFPASGAHKPTEDPLLLGDPGGQIGIRIKSPAAGTRVHITVTADDLAEPSTFDAELHKAGKTYEVFPKIKYKYRRLLAVRQKMPTDVTIDVTINDKPAGTQTVTVTLRSINDCPYWVEEHAGGGGAGADDKQDNGTDMSWMFAAYVNEDHPYIDGILKEALATGIVNSFDGYQSDDPAQVSLQVYAIWHTLQKRGIKYSDVTTHGGRNDVVYSQHVRFLDESLGGQQANCVDGSVLLASVLRKIGIEPILLTIPGHMYLGYYLDKAHKKAIALETTMMGDKDIDDFEEIEGLGDLVSPKWKKAPSYHLFNAAAQAGTKDMKANNKKFNTESEYQLISIAAARELGIAPIAFQKK